MNRKCRDCGRPLPAWNKHARCERCRKSVPCPTCGQPMYRYSCRCIHCQSANQNGEDNPNWRGGRTLDWYANYTLPYRQNNPEKIAAHRAVHTALRRGDLVRPSSCEDCGQAGRIEAHHPDYSQPLKVRWLCSSCHHAAHLVLVMVENAAVVS